MSNQRMRELFLENIERQRMGGDLVAGKRKRKVKHSKATPAQLAALRKARKAKKKYARGGDFEDVGDSDYKLFGAAYKNPLEQAVKKYYNEKKDEEWRENEGWIAYGKMAKQLNDMGKILSMANGQKYTDYPVNDQYDDYIKEKKKLKRASPYIKLLSKYGIKPTLAELNQIKRYEQMIINPKKEEEGH